MPEHASARVFLVDAACQGRGEVQSLFSAAGLCPQCFPSAEVFLRAVRQPARGCLVSALELPGMSGIELVAELNRTGRAMPCVVYTRRAEVCDAVRAIRAGAAEFVQASHIDKRVVDLARRAIEAIL